VKKSLVRLGSLAQEGQRSDAGDPEHLMIIVREMPCIAERRERL
jgi:hypothetical protein